MQPLLLVHLLALILDWFWRLAKHKNLKLVTGTWTLIVHVAMSASWGKLSQNDVPPARNCNMVKTSELQMHCWSLYLDTFLGDKVVVYWVKQSYFNFVWTSPEEIWCVLMTSTWILQPQRTTKGALSANAELCSVTYWFVITQTRWMTQVERKKLLVSTSLTGTWITLTGCSDDGRIESICHNRWTWWK